mgnify:CR=1 FL=1
MKGGKAELTAVATGMTQLWRLHRIAYKMIQISHSKKDKEMRLNLLRSVEVRYAGVEATLSVPWSQSWRADFEAAHRIVQVAEEDWGLQACTTSCGNTGKLPEDAPL